MLILKSLVFNVLFFIWTGLVVACAVPGLLIGQRYIICCAYFWGLGTHALLKSIVGVEYEIRGHDHWQGEAALFACKHQSTLETAMIQVLAYNSAIILKRELLWIPFFGQVVLRAGVIAIDRSKGRGVMTQLIDGAKKFIEEGRPIFIFPEGTRKPLEAPTELKAGIGALYEALGVPVYPIAINTGAVWTRRGFIKKPGKVIYEISPPIAPNLPKDKFLETLSDTLEERTRAICAETKDWQPAQTSFFKKNALILCLGGFGLVLGLYTLAWQMGAMRLESLVRSFKEKSQEKGFAFSYESFVVHGFPFHLRGTLSRPRLESTQWGTLTFGDDVETEIALFSPKLVHITTKGTLTLEGSILKTGFEGRALASHVSLREPLIVQGVIASPKFHGLLEGARADNLQVTLTYPQGAQKTQDRHVMLGLQGVRAPFLPIDQVDEAHLKASLTEPLGALTKEEVAVWAKKGGTLEIEEFSLKAPPLNVKADATFSLTERGRPEGAASLYVSGVNPFVDVLVRKGKLAAAEAQTYKLAFQLAGVFASSQGVQPKDGQIAISLTLQDGELSLGGMPLLKLSLETNDLLGGHARGE